MSSSQQFSLKWTNYTNHITNAFDSLRSKEDFCDVTLSCEGRKIRAHKVLLSACSTYFKEIFKDNPCQHPVIIFKNVKYDDLLSIVVYMYQGEVNIEQESLPTFLHTAEMLSIQGLTEDDKNEVAPPSLPPPPQPLPPSIPVVTVSNLSATSAQPTALAATISKAARETPQRATQKFTLTKHQPISVLGGSNMEQILYTAVAQATTVPSLVQGTFTSTTT